MPNHIINKVKASSEVIKSIINDGNIDFNLVINRPECITNTISPCPFTQEEIDNGEIDWGSHPSSQIRTKDVLEKAFNAVNECKALGLEGVDWYRWSITNWGTKWNAYNAVIVSSEEVHFQTAWNTPVKVFEVLSSKFPKEGITVIFADEDTGGKNCGTLKFLNGELKTHDIPKDLIKFALECWGEDTDNHEYYRTNPDTGLMEYFEE